MNCKCREGGEGEYYTKKGGGLKNYIWRDRNEVGVAVLLSALKYIANFEQINLNATNSINFIIH